jgi:hypothetical protein
MRMDDLKIFFKERFGADCPHNTQMELFYEIENKSIPVKLD